MPRFFFNYTSDGATFTDDVGTDFASLEVAYLDACECALAIAFERLRVREDPTADAFEILDENRAVLLELPFSEVLRPKTALERPPSRRLTGLAFQGFWREMARGEKLKQELGEELERTRRIFGAIRANTSSRRSS